MFDLHFNEHFIFFSINSSIISLLLSSVIRNYLKHKNTENIILCTFGIILSQISINTIFYFIIVLLFILYIHYFLRQYIPTATSPFFPPTQHCFPLLQINCSSISFQKKEQASQWYQWSLAKQDTKRLVIYPNIKAVLRPPNEKKLVSHAYKKNQR